MSYYHSKLFVLLLVVGKDMGKFYKYNQSQLSTSYLKATVSSSSDSQTLSATKSTITSVPSATDKNKNNSVFYSQNTIQNDGSITNNDDIHYFKKQEKNYRIPTTSTPNHCTQLFVTTSAIILNVHTPTILPPVGK